VQNPPSLSLDVIPVPAEGPASIGKYWRHWRTRHPIRAKARYSCFAVISTDGSLSAALVNAVIAGPRPSTYAVAAEYLRVRITRESHVTIPSMRAALWSLFLFAAIAPPTCRSAELASPIGLWKVFDDATGSPRALVRMNAFEPVASALLVFRPAVGPSSFSVPRGSP
jgi:hypothetical protein